MSETSEPTFSAINHNLNTWSIITVWLVQASQDERGGAPYTLIGLFRDREVAIKAAKGRAFFGSDADVRDRKAVEILTGQREGDDDTKQLFLLDEQFLIGTPLDQDLPKLKAKETAEALALLTPHQIQLIKQSA